MNDDQPKTEGQINPNSIKPPSIDGSRQSAALQPGRQKLPLYQNGVYPEPSSNVNTVDNSQEQDFNTVAKKKRLRGKKPLIFIVLFIMFWVSVYIRATNGFIKIEQTTPEEGSTLQRSRPRESNAPLAKQLLPLDNLCYSAALPKGFVRSVDDANGQKNKEDTDSCRQSLVSNNTAFDGDITTLTDFSSGTIGKLEDIKSLQTDDDSTSTSVVSDIKVDGSNAIRVKYRYTSEYSMNTQKTRVYVWNDKDQIFNDGTTYKYLIIEAVIRNADKPDIDSAAIDDFLQSFKWK